MLHGRTRFVGVFHAAWAEVSWAPGHDRGPTVLLGLGLIDRTPPEAILAEGVLSLLRKIPENPQTATIELAHWGYGGTAGALYSLLPSRIKRRRAAGPA